jgi:hypothetical protein
MKPENRFITASITITAVAHRDAISRQMSAAQAQATIGCATTVKN